MFVKWTDWLKVIEKDTKIGYDLKIGDFVHPYGTGKIKDIIFEARTEYRARYDNDYNFDITFSNEKDGIIEYVHPNDNSSFKWPYQAPIEDYQNKFHKYMNFRPHLGGYKNETNMDDSKRFIFRVRTEVDEKGNIISANYGYINSDIRGSAGFIKAGIDKDKSLPIIGFTYYFNPDNKSKSLEFNGYNLFLDRNEQGRLDDRRVDRDAQQKATELEETERQKAEEKKE